MDAGETFSVVVPADVRWVDTGVVIAPSDVYELSAVGQWWDRQYEAGPAGYLSRFLLQRLTEPLRLHRRAPWFALVGSLSRRRHTQFVIGSGTTYRPDKTGELCCFANDLPFMRGNNQGCVTLTIARVG